MSHLGAAFIPKAPRLDRVQTGLWPRPLPAWFWTWAAWVDHGRIPSLRPASAPAKIPAWAWARYQLHRPVKPKPPIEPPTAPVIVHGSRFAAAILAAQEPEACLGTKPTMPLFLSADPAYRQWATGDLLVRVRAQNRPLGAWCNPVEVPPDALREFARQIGVAETMLMGQGESAAELAISLDARLPAAVGNLSALTDDQRNRIKAAQIQWLQEDYWNVMPWLVPDWMGCPVAAVVAGLYPGEGPYGRYVPLPDFITAGRYVPGRDGFYHAVGPQAAGHPQDYLIAA